MAVMAMGVVSALSADGRDPAMTPTVGPVEFSITLPNGRPGTSEPLLAAGEAGRGDTIFVWFEKAGFVRFGWDSSASGTIFSRPVAAHGVGPHKLRISMGSLQQVVPPGSPSDSVAAVLSHLLIVQFDDRIVLRCEGEFQRLRSPEEIAMGINRVGSAIVRPFFTGRLGPVEPLEPELALMGTTRIDRWLAASSSASKRPGALRLIVRFSRVSAFAGDPLVVTGCGGAGDFIYVQTLDPSHVRFGFDHWALGGVASPPVKVDLGAAHDVVVTMGSLHDSLQPAERPWRDRIAVWLDGRLVLKGRSLCHPTTREQIRLGYNPIGGSTTGPVFRGTIFGADALSPVELNAMTP